MSFNPGSIFEIRQQLGVQGRPIPFSQLAAQLACTERSVRNWEKGQAEPRFSMLKKLDDFCQSQGIEAKFYIDPQSRLSEFDSPTTHQPPAASS